MPTATEYFGFSFSNLGPLTTTYTAPSSCATVNTDQVLFADKSDSLIPVGQPKCDSWTYGDCRPSGSNFDNLDADVLRNKALAGLFLYHSPGIVCPEGWNTVGMIAKDNGTLSVSGFMTNTYEGPTTEARHMQITEIWNGVLKPSETVAFCAPTNYEADSVGNFKSILGDYFDFSYSTWCSVFYRGMGAYQTVFTVPGITYEPGLLSYVPPTSVSWQTGYETYTGPEATSFVKDLVVITQAQVIPLIFQQSDLDAATASTTASTNEEEETSSGTTQAADNAALVLSVRSLVPVMTVFVSMLAGAGLLAPW